MRQSTGRDPLLSGHVEKNLAPDLPPLTPPNWVPKFPYVQELCNDSMFLVFKLKIWWQHGRCKKKCDIYQKAFFVSFLVV